jgi:hypothetical protein
VLKVDLCGKRYGKLLVLSEKRRKSRNDPIMWHCLCDCGRKCLKRPTNIVRYRSCGCLRGGSHNMSRTKVYRAHRAMLTRCLNKNCLQRKHYAGRGVTICKRWLKFENFYTDMGEPPTSKHSLDRINNNGNYEPGNCRWATPTQQARNTRSNKKLFYFGERKTIADWADELGIKSKVVYQRISRGWTIQRALETPLKRMSR